MRPKYLQASAGSRDRWMISYLDIVTILLVFFICASARAFHAPVVAQVTRPAPQPAPPPKPRRALEEAGDRLRQAGVDSVLESNGLVIGLSNVILFRSGEDTVTPEAAPILEEIADTLRDLPNSLQLIGHADAEPIHTRRFQSNWELSMARSLTILQLLRDRYGIDESRLSIAGFGVNHPAASNDTPLGRASNRRVEIVVLDAEPAQSSLKPADSQ